MKFDLDEYFARIGYAGPRAATRAVFSEIHRLHPDRIPFENLNPLMGREVAIDLPSVHKKLVAEKRGGYCFEHNALLAASLNALGFKVTPLSARVLRAAAPGVIPPRTHMVLRVEAEGQSYIADVGFGGQTMSAPLLLDERGAQKTPHEDYRLDEKDGVYELHAELAGEWRAIYRFTLEESGVGDYEVANWYTSRHPESLFTSRLMCARAAEGKRFALLNNEFSIHGAGKTEKRVLATAEEVAEVLESEFGIQLPEPRDDVLKALRKAMAQ